MNREFVPPCSTIKVVLPALSNPANDHKAFAGFEPHAATAVDFHRDKRAPLRFMARGKDPIAPVSVIGIPGARSARPVGGRSPTTRCPGLKTKDGTEAYYKD